jgi:peptide/nickel transport system substrate-binding protein
LTHATGSLRRFREDARVAKPLAALLAIAGLVGCTRRAAERRPEIERLIVAAPHQLITLDPHSQDTLSTWAILGNVYEGLVASDGELRVRPGLAERWESPDPLTWLFRLRPGVRFHDGYPLRAADVVHTLERLAADSRLDVRQYVWNVATVDALDPLTVRVRTRTPWPTLLAKLTQVYVVRAGEDTATLAQGTNGTGPYRLTEWRPGESVRLTRFDEYWGPRPAAREALIMQRDCAHVGPDELAEFDILATTCPEPVAARADFRLERRTSLYVKYLGMDVERERTPFVQAPRNPFRDPLVREALSLAVDRERLVRRLGLPAQPAYQLVPKTVVGFDPRLAPDRPDLGRARRLLARAGYPDGFRVTLQVREPLRQVVPALKADLAAIGVETDVQLLDEATFSDRMSRREGSLWLSRFACLGGDVGDLFETFFSGVRRFSVHGGYANAALERAFAQAALSQTELERRDRLKQLVADLGRDRPLIPLYNDEDVYLIRRGLAWQPRNDACLRIGDVNLTR